MKVLILATGKTEEHNESYGARLIEQGRAVLAPEKKTETGRRGRRPLHKTDAESSISGSGTEDSTP